MTATHLGIYPTTTALDHDAAVHLQAALDKLTAAGVNKTAAIESLQRVLSSQA